MTTTTRYQDVVCAFIFDGTPSPSQSPSSSGTRYLCAQRYADAEHFPDVWEFTGGKVDDGESHVDALLRECREELGVEISLLPSSDGKPHPSPCYSFHHKPKQDKRLGGMVTFRLFFYWAQIATGQPKPQALASQCIAWLLPEEMAGKTFVPGDEPIIASLCDGSLQPGAMLKC